MDENFRPSGSGCFVDVNTGGKYEGKWLNEVANGYGRFISPNGVVYVGEWLNDKYHGFGTYYAANGESRQGYW